MSDWKRLRPEDLPPGLAGLAASAGAQLEGDRIMDALHGRAGGTKWQVRGPLVGRLADWQQQLGRRLATHETTLCKHVSLTDPKPLIWLVFVPDRLRCVRCTREAARAVHGTPADDVCDGCGGTYPELHTVSGEIPGGMVGSFPVAPIILQGGLCDMCCAADEALIAGVSESGKRRGGEAIGGGDDAAS